MLKTKLNPNLKSWKIYLNGDLYSTIEIINPKDNNCEELYNRITEIETLMFNKPYKLLITKE